MLLNLIKYIENKSLFVYHSAGNKSCCKIIMPIKGILLMDNKMLYVFNVNSLWYAFISIST
jgi:hypothetical protein